MTIDGGVKLTDILAFLDLVFVQRMFIAGFLASLVCGTIGTYVVVRRNVFIAGGISHTTFGGIGLAYYLQGAYGWAWFDPLLGAVLFALGAAFILSTGWVRSRIREDSTIGVIWVVGMAIGSLFLALPESTGMKDPTSILFGDILLVGSSDLYIMAGFVLLIYVLTILFYKDLQILAFDEEFARISGIRVDLMNLMMSILIALSITVLIKVVGVVLIIAMLTIPAAIANLFTRDLKFMMLWATIIGIILTGGGSLLSLMADTPSGATIVLLMGGVFLLSLVAKGTINKIMGRAGKKREKSTGTVSSV